MAELQKLINGYKAFYKKFFIDDGEVYKDLSENGQFPDVAIIACSDSRVDPSIVTSAAPGDLFVIRNVANLVPPYQPDDSTYHGTSAALEFAINNLQVKYLVIMGHSKCAGIRELMESDPKTENHSFVNSWMQIATDVGKNVKATHKHLDAAGQIHICEKQAIEKSMENLKTFPWINEKIQSGKLKVIGWYFDIEKGKLYNFEKSSGNWSEIE
jgi:carbonic anhydrase